MALNNVPLAGQTLAVTRDPIRNNFNTIDTAFSVDHVAYNAAGQGKHNKVTFPLQAGAPVFVGTDIGLWSQNSPNTLLPEIYTINSNGNVYQVTASTLSTNPVIGDRTSGWSSFPSGLIMKWGLATAAGAINISSTGPAGGPNLGAAFNAQLTPFNAINLFAWVASLNNTTLNISTSFGLAPGQGVFWFVIGRE